MRDCASSPERTLQIEADKFGQSIPTFLRLIHPVKIAVVVKVAPVGEVGECLV